MKKRSIALIAFMAISSSVMAGEDIAPVVPDPVNNWDGFYIGIQTGYNWGDADVAWVDNAGTADQVDYQGPAYNVDGSIGGIYGGYNWLLSGKWLIGLEGEWNFMGAEDIQSTNYEGTDNFPGEVKQNWDASVRLRAGKIMGDFFPYITGGVAWGGFHVKQYYVNDPEYVYFDKDMTLTGWTLGAGLEWSVSSDVHLRVQYRYTDYGDEQKRDNWSSYGVVDPDDYTDAKLDYNAHQVTLGLTYQF